MEKCAQKGFDRADIVRDDRADIVRDVRLSAIQNRSDVESQLPKGPLPSPYERKILNYHLRNGTTSRLFKQIREKYLDYQP